MAGADLQVRNSSMPVALSRTLFCLLNEFQVFFCRSWSPAEVHWLSPAFLPFMEPHTQAVNASTLWPYISLAITGCFGEVQCLLLAWQPLLNHRVSHPAPQASHTPCKQAIPALAWKLLNSDSAGKLSKMGRRSALK